MRKGDFMTKIKICGLRRKEDIMYVNEFKPDFIGFVFADSKRHITDEEAEYLKSMLDSDIDAVGVFVNDDILHIKSLADKGVIDIIQLHGDESRDYIEKLKSVTDKKIIKAVRVKEKQSIIDSMNKESDYLLLDTYSNKMYGGSGKTFDRKMIPEECREYFLAGGLNESNLYDALSECNPYGVDLSSGVETDGFKDREKIRRVVEIVRKYNLQKEKI